MPFVPARHGHSLVEAAFAVNLNGMISPAAARSIAERCADLKDELPAFRLSGIDGGAVGLQVAIQPNGAIPMIHTPAFPLVEFAAFATAGFVEWRVQATGNIVSVHCGRYDRWATVWPKAQRLLMRFLSAFPDESLGAIHLGFQCVDAFIWEGELADYDAGQLIKADGWIPPTVLSRGDVWHSYQGWFVNPEALGCPASVPGRRMLDRLHIDAGQAANFFEEPVLPSNLTVVRIDDLHRLDFSEAVPFADLMCSGGAAEWAFACMHARNKAALGHVLTEDTVAKVKLNG